MPLSCDLPSKSDLVFCVMGQVTSIMRMNVELVMVRDGKLSELETRAGMRPNTGLPLLLLVLLPKSLSLERVFALLVMGGSISA